MSKFVRTKNGIYKVDAYDNAGTCIVGGFDNRKTFYKDEYLKMTDTIEELCDEFVIHNFSYYNKPYIPSQINIKDIPNCFGESDDGYNIGATVEFTDYLGKKRTFTKK